MKNHGQTILFGAMFLFTTLLANANLTPVIGDYDGDNISDLAVWDETTGVWHIRKSSDSSYTAFAWGTPASPYFDIAVPGDYDGDGKTDIGVFRKSDGHWYITKSSDGQALNITWGTANSTDVPVAADYDGDGTTDVALWQPYDGKWHIKQSSNSAVIDTVWGTGNSPEFDTPVVGDFDGDGKADMTVWRQSDNTWYTLKSSSNYDYQSPGSVSSTLWGIPGTDIAAAGDYDGDGKTDVAVWKPSDGNWYIIKSTGGQSIIPWGSGINPYNDISAAGDFDGDGNADQAVLRPGDAYWYVKSSNGINISAPIRSPDAKKSYHLFTGMRSGAIQLMNGDWEITDFALHVVNPTNVDMEIQLKLTADVTSFMYYNGQTHIWTDDRALTARGYQSINMSAPEVISFFVPILPRTNFTGQLEISGWVAGSNKTVPADFYVYLLPQTPIKTGIDPDMVYYNSWDEWSGQITGSWDTDLNAFIIPYTNYWHNLTNWPKGWHSNLTLKNNSDVSTTYTIKHVPDAYSSTATSTSDCSQIPYPGIPNQVGETQFHTVTGGDTDTLNLETLFGWPTDVGSNMEGYLVITPNVNGLSVQSTITGEVVPNTTGMASCPPYNSYYSTVAFNAPANNATVTGMVDLDTRIVTDKGVNPTDIIFFVDGNVIDTIVPISLLAFDTIQPWNSNSVSNGTHTLTVNLMRGAQQIATASITVNVQNVVTLVSNEKNVNQFIVYPNPNKGDFTIMSTSSLANDVSIFNTLGETIYTTKLNKENNFKISLANLRPGLYFIKDNKGVQKIVVQ